MYMFIKKRFTQFFALVILLIFTTSMVLSYSKHRGTNSRVSALLILSMKARDAGNMDRAFLFWKQAKSLRHGIAMPKWLSEPLAIAERRSKLSEKEAVDIIASLPYKLAKPIMEDMLDKNPNSNHIRKLFVKKAKLANDVQQVKRNKSLTTPKTSAKSESSVWKILFLIAMILLAIWQLYLIVFDIKRQDVKSDNDVEK